MQVLAWLKARATWLLATVVAILGAGWLWRIERDKRRSLQDQLRVERAKRSIAGHQARREALLERDSVDKEKVAKLDEQITDLQRKAVEVEEKVETRDAAQLAQRFNELYGDD